MELQEIIIYTLLFIFAILLILFLKSLFKEPFPFEKADSIVTKTEKEFLKVLLAIIPAEDFYVFSKVRLADIAKVKKGTNNYMKHFNKIKSKHIDFLICDSVDFEPLLAIELDDPSHLTEEAKGRDHIKNKVLEAAEIPILRIKTQKKYNKESLWKDIINIIG